MNCPFSFGEFQAMIDYHHASRLRPRHQEDAFVVQQANGPDATDSVGDDGHLRAQRIQLVPKLPGHVLKRLGKRNKNFR